MNELFEQVYSKNKLEESIPVVDQLIQQQEGQTQNQQQESSLFQYIYQNRKLEEEND